MAGRDQQTLPVLKAPVDSLRDGAVAFKQTVLTAHPVEVIQKNYLKNEWDSSLFIAEKVYGTHAAWEKRMDKAVLSQIQRLPGAPSSHALLDSYLGRDDKIEVEDILNLPEMRARAPRSTVHDQMERKLGLQ